MLSNTKQDRIVLSSQRVASTVGNIFDAVLVLADRMRELKSGAQPFTEAGSTMLTTAYREAEQGHLPRARLTTPRKRNK
jgi:DNA-directed RNA polymerase subunit K/omega